MGNKDEGAADPDKSAIVETEKAPSSEVDAFMDDLKGDNRNKLVPDPPEEPAPSAVDEEKEDDPDDPDKGKEKEILPFHKHPRFKQITTENRELKETVKNLETQVGKVVEGLNKGDDLQDINVPDWLKDLFGNQPEHFQNFAKYQKNTVAEITKSVIEAVQTNQATQQKQWDDEVKKWTTWVDEQFDELEEEGQKLNRDEIKKIALDYKPQDENGNISIRKAFDIWTDKQELKKIKGKDPAKANAKKQIAAKTKSKDGAVVTQPTVHTRDTLKGKSMHDLIS